MQLVRVNDKTIETLKRRRAMLEDRMNVKVSFRDNGVEVVGDPVNEYVAKDVIRAIDLGYNVKDALMLLEEGYTLRVIDLKRMNLSRSTIRRQLARVIGEHGSAIERFERKGHVKLKISGHNIGVLGLYEDVEILVEALLRLISGSPHKNVYRFIDEAETQKEVKEMYGY